MNRLQTEQNRLYLWPHPRLESQDAVAVEPGLIDANGRVRAMVVEVSQAAGWDGVAALWQGVQDELDWPAPAIAVSGINGFQVWFSLAEPVPVAQAQDLLAALRQRFMGTMAPKHISLKPFANDTQPQHARMVPALQPETGRWSAFVAPGLASMFAEEPWLDLPPSPEAQASLLSRFESIKAADFLQAQRQLQPAVLEAESAAAAAPVEGAGRFNAGPAHKSPDPQHFLLAVMNDPATDLRLRIEAAKALLPYF